MVRRNLIVEDEAVLREALKAALAGEGYAVRTAPDGVAVLTVHTEKPADVILSNVTMPELDGVWLVEELLARNDQTPVILMSANPIRSDQIPVVSHLRKPCDLDYLYTVVKSALLA